MKNQYNKEKWDQEYIQGVWDRLRFDTCELGYHAVVGAWCQKVLANGAVLDVGCGEGILRSYLNDDQISNYLGVDISSEAIDRAKKILGGSFICSSVEDFKIDQKFDVVVLSEILYYLDFKKTFQSLKSFLVPSGVFVVSLYLGNSRSQEIWNYLLRKMSLQYSTEVKSNWCKDCGRKDLIWRVGVFEKKKFIF